jgi:hypothetical protein
MVPPSSCTGRVRPATVLLRVSAAGQVESAALRTRSNCAAFNALAVSYAREQLVFRPATKGGQPVAAWILLVIQAL